MGTDKIFEPLMGFDTVETLFAANNLARRPARSIGTKKLIALLNIFHKDLRAIGTEKTSTILQTGFLPEQTLPGWEGSSLEQGVLQDTLNTTESRDDINPVVIKLPEFTIMPLVSPDEWLITAMNKTMSTFYL